MSKNIKITFIQVVTGNENHFQVLIDDEHRGFVTKEEDYTWTAENDNYEKKSGFVTRICAAKWLGSIK